MAGHSRPNDGVASARLFPGHPRLARGTKNVDARRTGLMTALSPNRSPCAQSREPSARMLTQA
ncbi:hypothetical protein [Bradyrhizobium sp. WSM2793]|uniref:hypothetical protein n=1 Tax=Bradyrhizobium sp. WSM2793 TaxID=1038866 RepID=UPI00037F0E47|nr:hypothetical protein [Bradyrhizobium sp. WSM2793]